MTYYPTPDDVRRWLVTRHPDKPTIEEQIRMIREAARRAREREEKKR